MKNYLKSLLWVGLCYLVDGNGAAPSTEKRSVTKNGVEVTWYFEGESVCFEMSAPTQGWVTIGFHPSQQIQGAYLLMGHVVNGKAEVVEHYTLKPGMYRPIHELGGQPQVYGVTGKQTEQRTELSFSLPLKAGSKYQRPLNPDWEYFMTLAYSAEDDFQHHSRMRTSVFIKL